MFAYRSILRERPRPAVIKENPGAPWLAVSVVCFGAFMGQLDAGISVAIVIRPAILGTLGQNRHGPRSPCSRSLPRRLPRSCLPAARRRGGPAERPREGGPSGADH